jgi:hypothetical protein
MASFEPRHRPVELWLPAYEKAGFFQLILEPKADTKETVTLPFVPWADAI